VHDHLVVLEEDQLGRHARAGLPQRGEQQQRPSQPAPVRHGEPVEQEKLVNRES
jgi:hypothetical protein